MADIKVLKVNADGLYQEHDEANDSLKVKELKLGAQVLDETKLGDLVAGGDASPQHHHDSLYFRETEHVASSAGVADASKPIVLDANGKLDSSFLPPIVSDHGDLTGLGDDDHVQYTLADGTRAFTGKVSYDTDKVFTDSKELVSKKYVDDSIGAIPAPDFTPYLKKDGSVAMEAEFDAGGFKIENLANPTVGTDAVNLQTMQAYLEGLKPKEAVRLATTGPIALATDLEAGDLIDGIALVAGDRVLVKDQASASENGIYIASASGAPVRATDFDSLTPIDEINGAYVPVSEGSVNAGKFFVKAGETSVLGTDGINFVFFNSVATLSGGDGITITGSDIEVDLASNAGLKFVSGELAIEPADFAGEGLIDDGVDNLAIDWSTTFNDAKAVKASDLNSTDLAKGASIIGLHDADGKFLATNVEAGMAELFDNIEILKNTKPDRVLYVTKLGNDTTGSGAQSNPFLTIKACQDYIIANMSPSFANPCIIRIGLGVFDEVNAFAPVSGIYLIGSGVFGGSDQTTIRRRNASDTAWEPITINVGQTESKAFVFENLSIGGGLTYNRLDKNLGQATGNSSVYLRRVSFRNGGTGSQNINFNGSSPATDWLFAQDDCQLGGLIASGADMYLSHGTSVGLITLTEGVDTVATNRIEGLYKTILSLNHVYQGGPLNVTGNVRIFSCGSKFDGGNCTIDKVNAGTAQTLYFDAISYPASYGTLSLLNGAVIGLTTPAQAIGLWGVANVSDWSAVPSNAKQAFDELASRVKIAENKIEDEAGHVKYTAGASGIAKGDLVYLSSANTVEKYTNLSNNDEVLGIALETVASGQTVQVSAIDEILEGVLTGAVVNARYYWDGSALATSMSTASGANVWLVGVAVSATDLAVKVRHVRKNA